MSSPTIVNIINFIRACEPRLEMDLIEPIREQLRLIRELKLPATWLLQYDALLDERIIRLLKDNLDERQEVGVWLEVVQPQVEAAGIVWRGRFPWDWHSHVGFTIGYPPEERERLMDMLMTRFHDVFGCYPISAGCWVLDAHTLRYLHERYGITAACNCKDQWGTDGYTLWGGYWNQAYYPSLVNAYMPAQHTKAQLSVPIFRMLGSDPIYQYDTGLYDGTNCSEVPAQGVVSLEPVYCGNGGGGDPRWVRWFFDLTAEGPSLSFGYAQAGQENSFGWPRMADGFTDQMRLLVERDDLRVETLADSAAWFRQTYPLTPAAAVVALDDWQEHNRRSVWYHSHHYRANLFWEGEAFRLRDLHLFDERYAERYLTAVCTSPACTYDTLPLVDGFRWSDARTRAGLYPVTASSEPLPCAAPAVTALDDETLQIVTEPLTFTCMPDEMHIAGTGDWRLEVRWGGDVPVPVTGVTADVVECRYEGFSYRWHVTQGEVGILAHGLRFTPRDGAVHCRFR